MTAVPSFDQISLTVDGPVALIELDRPDALNAVTVAMRDELLAAVDVTDARDDVRAVVFTGRGRAFCSGADLSAGPSRFAAADHVTSAPPDGGGVLNLRLYRSAKPLIAAINGPAVGLGATMTLPMDVRLVADGARVGFPFVRRGIVPDGCSTWFLPRLVGVATAAQWMYSGELVTAPELVEARFAVSSHPVEELLDAAGAIAERITHGTAPVSIALTRQLLWRSLATSEPETTHRAESRGLFLRGRSADAREGVSAFLERREPRFTDGGAAASGDLFADPAPSIE